MPISELECLSQAQWEQSAREHLTEVKHWTKPYRHRKACHQEHPVHDFLFTYYPFSPGKLEQWHPGYGIGLVCNERYPQSYHSRYYCRHEGVVSLNPGTLSEKEFYRLQWIHNLLSLTQSRNPHFGCHGMHEWAMVFGGNDIRHRESTPLRLSQGEIDDIVRSRSITCSHFDAYRFFSPDARPYNKLQPTMDSRTEYEQPGCLHTNMDLYKWASKCMPWIGSGLLWKCFQLALKARELDMRASPYDLSSYGYSPVKIETAGGRAEYETLQREISHLAKPLRQQLIHTLSQVIADAGQPAEK
ncbi:MAG: 3-methyladenine DNA glycosylase [Akkermansiaceae bacterium]